jgi:hypothetical protein
MKRRLIALLVGALMALSLGAPAALAGGTVDDGNCNAGRGNGSEGGTIPDCDPGNSGGNQGGD